MLPTSPRIATTSNLNCTPWSSFSNYKKYVARLLSKHHTPLSLQVGKNLWNNMVEAVDSRTSTYDVNQLSIKCLAEGGFISTTQ